MFKGERMSAGNYNDKSLKVVQKKRRNIDERVVALLLRANPQPQAMPLETSRGDKEHEEVGPLHFLQYQTP